MASGYGSRVMRSCYKDRERNNTPVDRRSEPVTDINKLHTGDGRVQLFVCSCMDRTYRYRGILPPAMRSPELPEGSLFWSSSSA